MSQQNSGTSGKRESRLPRGLVVRLTVYLVVGHLVAGFFWLLFELGASRQ